MLTVDEQTITAVVKDAWGDRPTPCYLLDEGRLLANMKKIERLKDRSGAKAVLALKCFSTWSVFDLMRPFLDGTTSSSLYEARLGHEKFGKETHAYSVAFSDEDIAAVRAYASKIIFNSVSQLERYRAAVRGIPIGLRVNPGVSFSHFDLADPARKCSRLGVTNLDDVMAVCDELSGVMFHFNCENDDFEALSQLLDGISAKYAPLLEKLRWVSLGGGIYFTKEGYPLDALADKLADFARRHGVQVYLEPGEAAVTQAGFFVTKVLDIVRNNGDIAIVDSAVETHLLDLLIYRQDAKMERPLDIGHSYIVSGKTCLAGDVFGTYNFPEKLAVGDLITFADAAGYSMVKKNWFNGVAMPSIAVRRLDGRIDVVKEFGYTDYLTNLS